MGKCNTIIIKGQGWGVGGSLFRMEMHALLFPLRMCQSHPTVSTHDFGVLWESLETGFLTPWVSQWVRQFLEREEGQGVGDGGGRGPFSVLILSLNIGKLATQSIERLKSCWNMRTGRAQLLQLWFPNLTPDWSRSHPFNTLLYRQMAIIWRQPKIGKTATVLEAHLFLWPSRLLLKCQLGDSSFSSL